MWIFSRKGQKDSKKSHQCTCFQLKRRSTQDIQPFATTAQPKSTLLTRLSTEALSYCPPKSRVSHGKSHNSCCIATIWASATCDCAPRPSFSKKHTRQKSPSLLELRTFRWGRSSRASTKVKPCIFSSICTPIYRLATERPSLTQHTRDMIFGHWESFSTNWYTRRVPSASREKTYFRRRSCGNTWLRSMRCGF